MALKRFTKDALNQYMDSLRDQYDGIRLVNPHECRTFSLSETGDFQYGPSCYGIWNIGSRCRNCISLKAVETGTKIDKDEEKDGRIYHIHTVPIEYVQDTGESYPCALEMITIQKKEEPVILSAPQPAFSREKFADSLFYVIQNMHSGIACFNLGGQCIYANAEAFRMFECRNELDSIQTLLNQWLDRSRFPEETWVQKFEGREKTKLFEIQRHPLLDALNKKIGWYCFFFDRTDYGRKIDVEHFRATHDELTQVLNRYGFYSAVRDLLEKDRKNNYLILVSDILNFKMVNEVFGVQRGNEILIATADMIRSDFESGPTAICGRLQGDRFAICMREDEFDSERLLSQIDALANKFTSQSLAIRTHIGIYPIRDRSLPISIMCDRALLALRDIRTRKDTPFAWYDDSMKETLLHDLSIINEFQDALASGQFEIYLQPEIRGKDQLIGAEALCRWNHPVRGILPPNEFIPILEDYGEIHHLDSYIWDTAFRLLRKWKNTPLADLFLSVNVSVKDFYYFDLCKVLTGLADRYEVPRNKLKLEITESVFMSDAKKILTLIHGLQEAGFSVEIDDFGSGFSSLNLLKDFSADVLKIDMGFLQDTENRNRSRTIMNAVISMSRALGMPVISEGVETPEQAEYLREIGCDIFQGYYYSKPVPIAEFERKYFPSVTFEEDTD